MHICELYHYLIFFGLSVTDLLSLAHSSINDFLPFDLAGKYCQLSLDGDLTQYMLGSKRFLVSADKSRLKKSTVLDMLTFTIMTGYIILISASVLFSTFSSSLAIRSSSLDEDTVSSSAAGAYHSELDVSLSVDQISDAINKVFIHIPHLAMITKF